MHPRTVDELSPEQREQFKKMTPEQVGEAIRFETDEQGYTTFGVDDFARWLDGIGVASYAHEETPPFLTLDTNLLRTAIRTWYARMDTGKRLPEYDLARVQAVADDFEFRAPSGTSPDRVAFSPEGFAVMLDSCGLIHYRDHHRELKVEAEPFARILPDWTLAAASDRREREETKREDQPA